MERPRKDGCIVKQTLIFPSLVLFLAIAAPRLCAQGVDCSSPRSNADETQCARQELTAAEDDLKLAFAEALRQYSGTIDKKDTTLPKSAATEQGQYEAKMRRALAASQEAFVQYRTAACLSVAQMYEGGSIAELEVASCKAALTRDRSKFLRDYFAEK